VVNKVFVSQTCYFTQIIEISLRFRNKKNARQNAVPSPDITMMQPEQTLEWVISLRFRGMHVVYDIILGIPVMMFLSLIPRSLVISCVILLPCVALLVFIIFFGNRPSRKLRVDRQAITLTEINTFGTRERRMTAAGVKVRAAYLDFFERLFTFDFFRACFAYHIEVSRNGEAFLFPCNDEAEQQQIIAKIKEFELGGIK